MKEELKGRVAIVTGAGSVRGIGIATAKIFAREGATVVLSDLDSAGVSANLNVLQDLGCPSLGITADLSSKPDVDNLFSKAVATFGRVDILVNNTGITQSVLTAAMSEAEWDCMVRVNLRSQFLCTRAAIPLMSKQKWGRIVCLSSMAGRGGPSFGAAHYAATKAGIIGFAQYVAREVAADGITVNVVAPGGIDTDMLRGKVRWDGKTQEELRANRSQNIPMKRMGAAEEVAEVIAFLSSDRSSFVTGVVVDINGGLHMC